MGIFRELFKELFEDELGELDRFLGSVKGENFRELEEKVCFRKGDSLGVGKRKRPFIALSNGSGRFKVIFLTTLHIGTLSLNIREKCLINKNKEYCRDLKEVCFTYRNAYLISGVTLRSVSEICGRCFDLEELESIPIGGAEG